MDFHEDLSRLGDKDGLKGRKLSKAVESFTWNITVLKVVDGSWPRWFRFTVIVKMSLIRIVESGCTLCF